MEGRIYQILKNHKLSPKKREEVLADLLLLLDEEQDKKMYSEEEVRDAYRWGTLVNQGTKEHFNEFINNLNNK
jgi:hypothetical protein